MRWTMAWKRLAWRAPNCSRIFRPSASQLTRVSRAENWTVEQSREPLAAISEYQLVSNAHLLELNSAPETVAIANQRIYIDRLAWGRNAKFDFHRLPDFELPADIERHPSLGKIIADALQSLAWDAGNLHYDPNTMSSVAPDSSRGWETVFKLLLGGHTMRFDSLSSTCSLLNLSSVARCRVVLATASPLRAGEISFLYDAATALAAGSGAVCTLLAK